MNTEFSIFQGAPSIHVENQQRVEEEEALKDQIRRRDELHNELQNAFEDLEEDDEDVNETMNSTNYSNGHSYNNHSNNRQFQQQKPFPLRDGETHLKNLLDSKVREIEYVTTQLTAERKKNKSVADEYEKRLAIAEAEKERALMNRNQTHELLVESKGRSIELADGNEKLRSKIKSLETENSKLVGELESTKLMLSDVQIKYNMVEKNVMFNADRNTDNILKQAQERHSAQIVMMQQQVDGLKSKFDDLEHDHKNLEIRYKELQRSRESMLIEKSEIINHLNKNLEDAQRQCQDLLSRPNLSQENRQLQNLVRSVESQKEEMNRTISKLQKRLQEQTSKMELMDSIVQECGGNNNSFSESTKFIHRDPLKNVNASTPVTSEERYARVKEELCKSFNNIKNKREEIKICEIQLHEKDEEIRQLKVDENKALVQMNQFRDETIRLESKSKILEKEIQKMRQELSQKSTKNGPVDEKCEVKIKNLREQKEKLEKELNSIKSDYETLSMKNGELVEKESEWVKKVQELEADLKSLEDVSKVHEDLKMEKEKNQRLDEELKFLKEDGVKMDQRKEQANVEDLSKNKSARSSLGACQKCDEYLLKLEKLKLSCLQMQNSNADYLSELHHLKQDLAEANRMIDNLEQKLNLKELRDEEIEKLKKKAQEFEDYIRSHTTRSASAASSLTNTSLTKADVSTETSDLNDDDMGRRTRQMETKARDEMAKIFAGEVKTLEKRFRDEMERLNNRMIVINEDLEETSHELSVRKEQMELLKFTILKEREESAELLKEKDEDFKVAIEKYRIEYEKNQQKVEELMEQLSEKRDLIDEERKSIENLKRQMNEERVLLAKREEETAQKLNKLQFESSKSAEELTEKFLSAKKTAMNYKQYSEDKENHFRNECERMKKLYKEAAENMHKKLEQRWKESLSVKEKNYQEGIKRIEKEYEFKVEILKDLLEKKN